MKEQLGTCPTCGGKQDKPYTEIFYWTGTASVVLPDAGTHIACPDPFHDAAESPAPGEPDAPPEIKALARWKATVGGTISVSEGNAFMDGYYAGRASQPPAVRRELEKEIKREIAASIRESLPRRNSVGEFSRFADQLERESQ